MCAVVNTILGKVIFLGDLQEDLVEQIIYAGHGKPGFFGWYLLSVMYTLLVYFFDGRLQSAPAWANPLLLA